jgi:hypothetical protein
LRVDEVQYSTPPLSAPVSDIQTDDLHEVPSWNRSGDVLGAD